LRFSTVPDETIDSPADGGASLQVLVAARDEERLIGATLQALADAFPGAVLWVADDGSRDGTAALALGAGARVVGGRPAGKGAAMSRAAEVALAELDPGANPVFLLCDGDLGDSAGRLGPLVEAVAGGRADVAVAAFAQRLGGGLGLAVGFARWALVRRCGLVSWAPISGQRAMTAGTLRRALPLASGYGMELGMTIDLVRAGARLQELELDLSHRVTGRTVGGFLHRGRQLLDFVRVYLSRR
jgi:glycosyltransferase involved in cell wall biosynthesis